MILWFYTRLNINAIYISIDCFTKRLRKEILVYICCCWECSPQKICQFWTFSHGMQHKFIWVPTADWPDIAATNIMVFLWKTMKISIGWHHWKDIWGVHRTTGKSILNTCWKTSQGTQYDGDIPRDVPAYVVLECGPTVFLKLYRNIVKPVDTLSAR